MRLVLHVPGASAAELARGVHAAHAAFDAAGISPWLGHIGRIEREVWLDAGSEDDEMPSVDAMRAAYAWDKAERAALVACCAGWAAGQGEGLLEVRHTEARIAQQIMGATKQLLDAADVNTLWRILHRGGLSATVLQVQGWPQVQVQLDDRDGPLASFGKLDANDVVTEELARLAQRWNEEPVSGSLPSTQTHFERAARRHLDRQIHDCTDLFEAAAREWQDGPPQATAHR